MRTASDLPNPLSAHAVAPADMNGAPAAPPRLELQHSHAAASRPGSAATTNVSPTSADMENEVRPARLASTSTQSTRPSFLRAKSDFGPRQPSFAPDHAEEGSIDGHFKIRHGWDDQLNSEEYSNLLTSVRILPAWRPRTD